MIPHKTIRWSYEHPRHRRVMSMPELHAVGQRACDGVDALLAQVAAALDEFLPQTDRQIIRELDGGFLVVTVQRPDEDVRQLLFHRDDVPGLPEETQALVRQWLGAQQTRDARRRLERN
jgi:hypothetical protein